jgi:arginine/ornithine transport system permease protein
MEFGLIWDHMPRFMEGVWTTIQLVALALIVGGAVSIPLAFARNSGNVFLNAPVYAFTYVFRGTPLLVQTYLIYNGLSQFDAVRDGFLWPILREAYWCALIAFTLNTCAYTTEIFRGGIQSVPWGEVEAAKACGMSPMLRIRRIILPSALRRALPAYSNEVIFMLHGSVIASVITIIDILGAGRELNAKHYLAFEGFVTAGVLYLCLTFMIVGGFKLLEKRWYKHLAPREAGTAPATA